MGNRWICPHCEHAGIVTYGESVRSGSATSNMAGADGNWHSIIQYVSCPNPACKLTTIHVSFGTAQPTTPGNYEFIDQRRVKTIQLRPASYARPVPDYVPVPIREDYTEACAILDLSPKASATLARRALQGMIRDFHGVVKATLALEIEGIRDRVDPLTWKAIDAVRSVGNIGAHMEKDINVIVDVEPDEAARLIRLIELLIKEWYVARHVREVELAAIVAMNEQKQDARKGGQPPTR